MRRLIIPDVPAILGAIVGGGMCALGIAIADPTGDRIPFTVLLVLSIALVGLLLGAKAALWAYVAGSTVMLVDAALPVAREQYDPTDLVRLLALVFGSPLIVLLVRRGEVARQMASEALAASHAAEEAAKAERIRLERTRHELDVALVEVERERARLEEVAEAIPEPLIVYDPELRGTYGNRAALRLFGRAFVERPIDEWGRFAEPRDERNRPLDPAEWPQRLAQAGPIRLRLILRVPLSGRDVLVDVEGTPIPGGGAVLLLRDVGKEEDMRRRLSRFAAFVAHELRNPLAVAKARIELAQRDPDLPSRAAGHAQRAHESVDAAIGILERLELYSRADSGRVEALREPFDLAPAIASAIERLRARGSERDVEVSISSRIRVIGDRPLTEQAITNLLTNADRYANPGTPIHVEVTDGDPVALRVRDEGPGIADEVADVLFHDRVGGSRGLGLGLYLVNATMNAMGGSVQLEQRRPGAVFTLRWPRAAPVVEDGSTA
ncbi:MAG TPA: HAMP domain-containing sensor histidine kinase [Candidatus Limnocylindria bacterium]|nr:HAMP domain-containing sensor histidine kinase [Candidatus Limnocylindria bacterium]